MDSRVHRLGFYEEAVGVLHDVREEDGYLLAIIGPVVVVLPYGLGAKIRPHIGSRIGILRTEYVQVQGLPSRKECRFSQEQTHRDCWVLMDDL
jgi:hypothetical protein